MKKIKVLIAEDHEVVAYGLRAMFHENNRLEFCSDVYKAQDILPRLKAEQADILILDANINQTNTITLLPEIKRRFESLKVVFFTAYDTPQMEQKAILHGADIFLNKKTSKELLLQAMLGFFENGTSNPTKTTSKNQNYEEVMDRFMIERLLTNRELEILKLVASGKTSQQIAEPLFISKHTVQWHRKNIIRKLDLHTTGELIRFVYEYGLLDPKE